MATPFSNAQDLVFLFLFLFFSLSLTLFIG